MNFKTYSAQQKYWKKETVALRKILLKTRLVEEFKWGHPCYCYGKHNIVIIQPFKSSLRLLFFKGILLADHQNKLVANGPHSHASKRFEFHNLDDVKKMAAVIKSYIIEAIALEVQGKKVPSKRLKTVLPPEFKHVFRENPDLKKAFNALTVGRQRAYILFISSAKQSVTRLNRLRKQIPQILKGKGLHDR